MKTKKLFYKFWPRFWMRIAEINGLRRVGMRIAAWSVVPYKARISLSDTYPCGFIESNAIIHHPELKIGKHCFIGRDVVIFERKNGGYIKLDDRVQVNRGSVMETGMGGCITIGYNSSIHPFCHIYAYIAPITVGSGVMLAPNCALYSYDHGLAPGKPIRTQPLSTKGAIVIGDEAWLGFGTIVLSGVKIGKGAAIGAGSVVTSDIPDNAIAAGNPAKVIKMRT